MNEHPIGIVRDFDEDYKIHQKEKVDKSESNRLDAEVVEFAFHIGQYLEGKISEHNFMRFVRPFFLQQHDQSRFKILFDRATQGISDDQRKRLLQLIQKWVSNAAQYHTYVSEE